MRTEQTLIGGMAVLVGTIGLLVMMVCVDDPGARWLLWGALGTVVSSCVALYAVTTRSR